MKITVEMTEAEFAEYSLFRTAKKVQDTAFRELEARANRLAREIYAGLVIDDEKRVAEISYDRASLLVGLADGI